MSRRIVPAFALALAGTAVAVAAPAPPHFLDYAPEFDHFEEATRGMPAEARVKAFHEKFDQLLPGMYATVPDRQIVYSLEDFPKIRDAYRRAEQRFPGALDTAVVHFRTFFPDFESPFPIYLLHDLGQRDGGTMTANGQELMVFGADMIAKLHDDDSLRPFLEHELFHLEHAHHFTCDIYWCQLWKEGLATYAASVMTPGATDRQLLLEAPAPIRAATDARMTQALCFVSANFDSADDMPIKQSFRVSGHADDLPARFGYYIGLRVAQKTMAHRDFAAVTNMNEVTARPVVRAALLELMAQAKANCAPPSYARPADAAN